MKRSGTTVIFIVVWAAVLFAAFVIGICIREVRFHRAKVKSTVNIETETSSKIQVPNETEQLAKELAQRSPTPEPGDTEMPGIRFPEEESGLEDPRRNMRERFANMSEEERAQMRERFGGRGRRGGERFQNLSEEERARLREEREKMRERMENMSEEERREYMAQMRERFGGRRREGNREGERPEAEEQEQEND